MKQIQAKTQMSITLEQTKEAFDYSSLVLSSQILKDNTDLISTTSTESDKKDYIDVERSINFFIIPTEDMEDLLFQIKNLQFVPDVRCEALYINLMKILNRN